jgi:hypothetical protein
MKDAESEKGADHRWRGCQGEGLKSAQSMTMAALRTSWDENENQVLLHVLSALMDMP